MALTLVSAFTILVIMVFLVTFDLIDRECRRVTRFCALAYASHDLVLLGED